jgi:hypothetical protein
MYIALALLPYPRLSPYLYIHFTNESQPPPGRDIISDVLIQIFVTLLVKYLPTL